MKKISMMTAIFVLIFTVPLIAQNKMTKEKEMTIKGEVVDVSCYLHMGARGNDHKECAEKCAKNGGALGILTKDGKLYVSIIKDEHLENPNAMLMDHITHTVEAKGYVHSKGGVNAIRITSVAMAK